MLRRSSMVAVLLYYVWIGINVCNLYLFKYIDALPIRITRGMTNVICSVMNNIEDFCKLEKKTIASMKYISKNIPEKENFVSQMSQYAVRRLVL